MSAILAPLTGLRPQPWGWRENVEIVEENTALGADGARDRDRGGRHSGGTAAYEISAERLSLTDKAAKRGDAALDMLESVHTQAMLNRKEVGEDYPSST